MLAHRHAPVRAVGAALLSALALLNVRPAESQVLFRDDFENTVTHPDGTIGTWDGPHDPTSLYLTTQIARSGRQSVELNYRPGTFGASFMYKLIAGQDRIYVRW